MNFPAEEEKTFIPEVHGEILEEENRELRELLVHLTSKLEKFEKNGNTMENPSELTLIDMMTKTQEEFAAVKMVLIRIQNWNNDLEGWPQIPLGARAELDQLLNEATHLRTSEGLEKLKEDKRKAQAVLDAKRDARRG